MDSQFTMDMPWLSSVVDKRELLAPGWNNIEDGNVAVSFTLSSDIVCYRAIFVAPRRNLLSLKTHWP